MNIVNYSMMKIDMYIKVSIDFLLFFFFSSFSCFSQTRIVKANDILEVLYKEQRKLNGKSVALENDIIRRLLLEYSHMWHEPSSSDTLYVIGLSNLNADENHEYIILDDNVYRWKSKYTRPQQIQVYPFHRPFEPMVDIVLNWDTNIFEKWKTTSVNDGDYVDALRIVCLKNGKYECTHYGFYDNRGMSEFQHEMQKPIFEMSTDSLLKDNMSSFILKKKKISRFYFSNVQQMDSICVPNGVEEIEAYAFANCRNLRIVYLPKSIRCIDKEAFYGCAHLQKIVLDRNAPPTLLQTTEPFGSMKNVKICVPQSSWKNYMKHPVWSKFQLAGF